MRVGTKSLLFGVHAVWIHPFFVAWAWWRLFGFPWDFRIWAACFLHDAGYIGKRDMDGFEGEQHVVLGGRIMGWIFGPEWRDFTRHRRYPPISEPSREFLIKNGGRCRRPPGRKLKWAMRTLPPSPAAFFMPETGFISHVCRQ